MQQIAAKSIRNNNITNYFAMEKMFQRTFQMSDFLDEFKLFKNFDIMGRGCLFYIPPGFTNDIVGPSIVLLANTARKGDKIGDFDNIHSGEIKHLTILLCGIPAFVIAYIWKVRTTPGKEFNTQEIVDEYRRISGNGLISDMMSQLYGAVATYDFEVLANCLSFSAYDIEAIKYQIEACTTLLDQENTKSPKWIDFLQNPSKVFYSLTDEMEFVIQSQLYGCGNVVKKRINSSESDSANKDLKDKTVGRGFGIGILNYLGYVNNLQKSCIERTLNCVLLKDIKIEIDAQEAFCAHRKYMENLYDESYKNNPNVLLEEHPEIRRGIVLLIREWKNLINSELFCYTFLTEEQASNLIDYWVAYITYLHDYYNKLAKEKYGSDYFDKQKGLSGKLSKYIIEEGHTIKQIFSAYVRLSDENIKHAPDKIEILGQLIREGLVQLPDQTQDELRTDLVQLFGMNDVDPSAFSRAYKKLKRK